MTSDDDAPSIPCRVVKLGGSLLDRPELSDQLSRWFQAQSKMHFVWIVGGGPLADAMRTWDRMHRLGQEFCHWRCLELLSTTAEVARGLISAATQHDDVPVVHDRMTLALRLTSSSRPRHQVFDIGRALRERRSPWSTYDLPQHWDVTSDSLAALVACEIRADELVLLKSCPPPDPPTVMRAVECGIVDPYFPHLASRLAQVRFEQLSDTRSSPTA